MKKVLFFVVFVDSVFGGGSSVKGQVIHYLGLFIDSTTFTFIVQDSLHHILYPLYPLSHCDTTQLNIDTSYNDSINTNLWVIGNTSKPFFADSVYASGIMTDTVNYYPVNSNSWFIIKYFTPFCLWPAPNYDYTVISFWHKYQTSPGLDGGIVEYSADSGNSWNNVMNICSLDTFNFYNLNDTLSTGEPAFSGTSNGWIESQFKLDFTFSCLSNIAYQIRFRFKSDSIPDTLAGWIIGKINIEQDSWSEGGVTKRNKPSVLNIYPNPSQDALFNFPALDEEKGYSIEIINAMGGRVLRIPYKHEINLSGFPKGLYFYRVSNPEVGTSGLECYNGKLVVE